MLNYIMAIIIEVYPLAAGRAAHALVSSNELALRDLCGNKRLRLSTTPDSLHPPSPCSPSTEHDRPRAERRSLPGGVIRLGPKSPAGRPVCDWRRPSPALVTA